MVNGAHSQFPKRVTTSAFKHHLHHHNYEKDKKKEKEKYNMILYDTL
jgi:hypothetical protein